MIGIVDYGLGNLRSVQKALELLGYSACLAADKNQLEQFKALILPGVGAFGQGVRNLQTRGLFQPLKQWINEGKPLLGICLGMQLLFEESEEDPGVKGLGVFPGRVVRFEDKLKVPQVGWNRLEIKKEAPLFSGLKDGQFAYFVHSYYVVPEDDGLIALTSNYGVDFPAAVGEKNCWGTQFHPEKSSGTGLKILSNYGGIYDEGNSGN